MLFSNFTASVDGFGSLEFIVLCTLVRKSVFWQLGIISLGWEEIWAQIGFSNWIDFLD
jgi:hypothetical protein